MQWLPPSALSDAEEVHAPTDLWVEGLRQQSQRTAMLRLKRVMFELLADQAIEAPVSEGGAIVRMVPQSAVRAEFFARTAAEDEEEQTRQGKHAQFSKARDRAEERQLIGIGKVERETHLWLCHSADEVAP